jgi:hypothetical protein
MMLKYVEYVYKSTALRVTQTAQYMKRLQFVSPTLIPMKFRQV